jgi:hypothetical protein
MFNCMFLQQIKIIQHLALQTLGISANFALGNREYKYLKYYYIELIILSLLLIYLMC